MDRLGGALGSYGDRCVGCGRDCLHRVLAVHVDAAPAAPVLTRVVPSCGPECDAAAASRAVRPRPGQQVTTVAWRRDGADWCVDGPAEPAPDASERAVLAAAGRWFRPLHCGHRPRHVAEVLVGSAQDAAWTRWSCPAEATDSTPAADARLRDVVEHLAARWNPALLRYDAGPHRHPGGLAGLAVPVVPPSQRPGPHGRDSPESQPVRPDWR